MTYEMCEGCDHPAHWRACRAPGVHGACQCRRRGPTGGRDYGIAYVETVELIEMLRAAHDYAAANEHRADYWTAMAAYLQAKGYSYQCTPPRVPIDWEALGLAEP